MRILSVTQSYFPFLDRGGPAVKVRAIAKGLAAHGHRVTVLSADLGFGKNGTLIAGMHKTRWGCRMDEAGVEAFYLSTLGHYRSLTLNPGVLAFCGASINQFDIVHIYGLYDLLGLAVGFFCRRREVPYVLEPMGMYKPIVRNLRRKRIYHQFLGRSLAHGARSLIATSVQEKNELLASGIEASRICVRRNGIEVPAELPPPGTFRNRWQIPREAKLILFLGRLVSKKSPDLLLDAYARWHLGGGGTVPSVLVLAGPDEGDGYLQNLETLTSQRGLGDHVLFTGPLYDEAKWAAYVDADVFVLPSQHENFGNTASEAVACGVPVIITDCCGVAPLIEGRAGLVIKHDVQDLQAALSQILGDDSSKSRYTSGCSETKAKLSWAEPLNELEALYKSLITVSRSR